MAGKYRSKREKKRFFKQVLIAASVFFAACMIIIIVFAAVDQVPVLNQQELETETEELQIVELNGEKYIPKKNIETYLFMGIDDSGKVRKREEYDGTGQCDTIILLVRDKSEGTYKTLPLDRNTMMDVKSLDTDGTYLATTKNQLSLAHSDGDGLEMSCENVVDAVSNFFYGQKIDGYAAVNMGCIEIINHLIGGVTVTIEDDFSEMDPSLKMGETILLTDEQAVSYIRGRMNVGDGTNEGRLRRQSDYMRKAKEKLKTLCAEDSQFPMQVYEALEEYMVTNISKQKFSKIALLVTKEKDAGELQIKGNTIIGEMEFEEFWADEESIADVAAQLFYKRYE